LKKLGLRIQLGHPDGLPCPLPCAAFNDDFTVIDSDGIHEVALDYCGCHIALPKTIQLLRARLFPSTIIDPKTAASFRVLETFQMLSFTSKVSGYEYYRSLERRTDNTGCVTIPVRLELIHLVITASPFIGSLSRIYEDDTGMASRTTPKENGERSR
jgi:hypothetical protein